MQINIDTHVHSEASFDSEQTVYDIASASIKENIHAVCICDHDISYSGPAVIDGVTIIPGIEISTDRGHLLGLFISSRVEPTKDFYTALNRIKKAGGIAVLAHPYERHHVPKEENDRMIEEICGKLDGIEAVNSRAAQFVKNANKYAFEAAEKYGLPVFAGSDAHMISEVGSTFITIESESNTLEAIKSAILNGNSRIFTKGTVRRVNLIKSEYVKTKKAENKPKAVCKLLFRTAKAVIFEVIRPEKRKLREFGKDN